MSGTEIDIAWVLDIAKKTRDQIAADAETNTNEFRNTTFEPSAVGTLPVSLDYASQVQAAHAFFEETIQGVIADLQVFGDQLEASARAHDENDASAAAALNAFDVDYQQQDATDYHSHESNQESASDEDLQVSDEAEQAAEAAEQDSGASVPLDGWDASQQADQGEPAGPSADSGTTGYEAP